LRGARSGRAPRHGCGEWRTLLAGRSLRRGERRSAKQRLWRRYERRTRQAALSKEQDHEDVIANCRRYGGCVGADVGRLHQSAQLAVLPRGWATSPSNAVSGSGSVGRGRHTRALLTVLKLGRRSWRPDTQTAVGALGGADSLSICLAPTSRIGPWTRSRLRRAGGRGSPEAPTR